MLVPEEVCLKKKQMLVFTTSLYFYTLSKQCFEIKFSIYLITVCLCIWNTLRRMAEGGCNIENMSVTRKSHHVACPALSDVLL